MHALLKTTVEEPIQINRVLCLTEQINPVLSNECRRRLRYMHMHSFDWKQGGLLSPVKFIDRDSVEYALLMAANHDQNEERMASMTLDNAMSLLDPIWGGVYQYSTQGKWDVPHYRKTMAAQAGHLRLYALAYAQLKHDCYLAVTQSIRSYIEQFLCGNEGAFYCGQSDNIPGINSRLFFSLREKERKLIGMPDIDKRISTRENGWAIEALLTAYEYCGDQGGLLMALKAGKWINKHCSTHNGGWLPNRMSDQSMQLADNLAMARAMLQLYRVTFKNIYLASACHTADYINRNFKHEICGYNSLQTNLSKQPVPRQIDENIALTRFANLLHHYTNEEKYKKMAQHGFRYLCIPEIATSRMEEAGILLIDHELQTPPLTFNIEGKTCDPILNPFLQIAYRHPGWYKLIKFNASDKESVSIEIEGIRSRPVQTTERLKDLLHNH